MARRSWIVFSYCKRVRRRSVREPGGGWPRRSASSKRSLIQDTTCLRSACGGCGFLLGGHVARFQPIQDLGPQPRLVRGGKVRGQDVQPQPGLCQGFAMAGKTMLLQEGTDISRKSILGGRRRCHPLWHRTSQRQHLSTKSSESQCQGCQLFHVRFPLRQLHRWIDADFGTPGGQGGRGSCRAWTFCSAGASPASPSPPNP